MDELQVIAACIGQINTLADHESRSRVCAYLTARFKSLEPEPAPLQAPVQAPVDESRLQKLHDYRMGFIRLHLPTFAENRLRRALIEYEQDGRCSGIFAPTGLFLSFDEWAAYHHETKGKHLSTAGIGGAARERILTAISAWLAGFNEPMERTRRVKALRSAIANNLILSTRVCNALLREMDAFEQRGQNIDAFETEGVVMTFDEWTKFHAETGGREFTCMRGIGMASVNEIVHAIGFYLDEVKRS